MDEAYYLGTYWGARKESASECAVRAEALLSHLPDVDPSFDRWFQQGKSRKSALKKPIETSAAQMERWVNRGKDCVVEELGYRLRGWNGVPDDRDASSFDATCGGCSARVNNYWLFDLPIQGAVASRVLTGPVLSKLLRATAVAWEPDWGVAMSHAHRNIAEPRRAAKSPYVGWVTYLARHRGPVPPLPAPVRIEQVEDKGTIIILTPERFTASNPEHVALAERVRELLDRAGLLKPLQAQP
ncbi:immunity 52 family protein [Myxococcus sp. AM001]|uniref:immunity 52 family protein n=1 Tax=Myxococcus vastator TaxID=2709664 RepID=UPI0013D6A036|nr:immunity 52 family protein [Myxococcus vastator]NVJ04378.1 immunity 52 family protein [Myxococcus sp. AM001]